MKRILLALVITSVSTLAHAGDGVTRTAPFPSPRRSGAGRIAFTASNVLLRGWLPISEFPGGNSSASDCWGYTSPAGREYALIGLSGGTGFVEVTDPGAPVLVDFEPHNSVQSLWRCLKVYGAYAYAGSEGGGGIQIFDMTNIDAGSVTASSVTGSSCTTATHTMALDAVSGFLYRAGGIGCNAQGLQIYSLANPAVPTLVGQWNDSYVHECQVVTWDLPGAHLGKQIAFCCTGGNGVPRLRILDVTNKAAIALIASRDYPGSEYSHQCWLSANKQHLYLNDESDDTAFGASRTRIFDISDLSNPIYLGFFNSGAPSIDHNLYVKDNRIYESNYRSGLRVFDNTVPTAPVQIGYFDTVPEDDAKDTSSLLWSNYPYFASGTLLGSDVEKGLFLWRYGPARLSFAFPGEPPESLGTSGGPIQFEVSENTPGDLDAGTVQFHFSTDGAFTTVNASLIGSGLYEAMLPALPCGTPLVYYVSAQDVDGATWSDPPAGPTQVHEAVATYGESVASEEDMESATAWGVNLAADLAGFTTATSGTWTRVDPHGTAAQPEYDHSPAGTSCWVTQQGAIGGSAGEADIDGGATSLRSPVLDAAGLADPHLSYWRWFSNNTGSAADDVMTVHVSNDGGASWVLLEAVGPTGIGAGGGWFRHSVRIADFVAPTSTMLVLFRASDLGVGSIVEAAVDELRIVDYDCTLHDVTLASIDPRRGPFEGGNVVTLRGTGFQAGVTTVRFGGRQADVVDFVSSTTLKVRVPHGLGQVGAKTGRLPRVNVSVTNPGAATLPDAYAYVPNGL